jgi:hypothetical protein
VDNTLEHRPRHGCLLPDTVSNALTGSVPQPQRMSLERIQISSRLLSFDADSFLLGIKEIIIDASMAAWAAINGPEFGIL